MKIYINIGKLNTHSEAKSSLIQAVINTVARYLGVEPRSLAQKSPRDEPEAVGDAELVLHNGWLRQARMWVAPLIWGEPRHHEERETDKKVGS